MKDFNGCRLGVYEKSLPAELSFLDRLLIFKDSGFDFMEISIDETEERMSRLEWPKDKKLELIRAINCSGIPILTMCLSANRLYPIGCQDNEIRAKGLELIKKAIDFSVDIGIRIVQVAGYDEYYHESNETTGKLFCESLKEAVSYASRTGVILAIENIDTPFMDSVEKISRCASSMNSPYIQIYPDIGNLAATGNYPVDIETVFNNKSILGYHLKDTLPGKIRNIPYGQGIVNFTGFFKTMINLDFSGMYMAEMWASNDKASLKYIETARDFLAAKFREAAEQEKI